MFKLKIIISTTRPGRFSETLVPWLTESIEKRGDIDFEFLDLRDYQIPYYNLTVTPKSITDGAYPEPIVKAWADKIAEADAFIIITSEYNHSYPATLKSALDAVYNEWVKKPVALIGYGTVGGARAVEQLRPVLSELQMVSMQNAVHIFSPWNLREEDGSLKPKAMETYSKSLETTLDQLQWWTKALIAAKAA